MVNACEALECPYSAKDGCTRFTMAGHCPIIYQKPGVLYDEVERTSFGSPSSQYWVYLKDGTDLEDYRQRHRDFINGPDEQERLDRRNRFKR